MGDVRKAEGWPERLAETVEAAMAQPFSWAGHNCGLFVADCCLAMTGEDPADGFLRNAGFDDEAGARTGLRKVGARGGSVGAFAAKIARRWKAESVPARRAQRGDIMVVMHAGRAVLGVCWNGRIAVVTPAGLTWLPVDAAHAAWRIRD